MAIRLMVFDVAGTTVKNEGRAVQRAMRDALDTAGLTLRDGAMEGVTGFAKIDAIRTLIEGHGRDELLGRIDAIHADFVVRIKRFYRDDARVAPVEGVPDAFKALRAAGVKVALNTGFSREILDVVLARLGWDTSDAPIDTTIASDEVPRGRPYPDMIDALRARLGGIPYTEVGKVGDTPVDLQEGTMARCGLVVGVLSGVHDRDSLAQHPHDALLESASGVMTVLTERGLLPA